MTDDTRVFLGTAEEKQYLNLKLANRHGLITGATGTGKTVSLQILAEGFSNAGVPVFAADIKGDLSGLAEAGAGKDFLIRRAEDIGFADDYQFEAFPAVFWDLFGKQGHPIRTTITEMGPLLLARLMNLTSVQEGVLNIAFKIADMATELEAARLLVHRAAWMRDKNIPCTKYCSMAKLYASQAANRAAQEAVQIHGGAGYTKEFPVERFFRDAKITQIYEGTQEVQRIVIARALK